MLLVVDLQNDYFHIDGKYYFEGVKEIINPIKDRIKEATMNGEPIIATVNLYHDLDERPEEIRKWASQIYGDFKDDLKSAEFLEKFYYGISIDQSKKLKDIYDKIQPAFIELVGAETDVCVLANAVIFQSIFSESEIIISKSRNATSHPENLEALWQILQRLKIRVID